MDLLAQSNGDAGFGIVLLITMVIIGISYFIPSVVALVRSHHNVGAIIALNLLLGWTVIGWIAAFVWALTNPPKAAA